MKESNFKCKVFLWLTIIIFSSVNISWAQTGRSKQKPGQENLSRPVRSKDSKVSITPNWKALEKWVAKRPALATSGTRLAGKELTRHMVDQAKLQTGPSYSRLKSKGLRSAASLEARTKSKASRKAFLVRNRKGEAAGLRRAADEPTRLYVDQANEYGDIQDGISWETAYSRLADALKFASDSPDVIEIWVAYGVYKPFYAPDYSNEEPNTDRDNAFVLRSNLKIYGGFYGVEEFLEERDLTDAEDFGFILGGEGFVNATVLSGDFEDDDGGEEGPFAFTAENARHVVIAIGDVGNAALDGLIITGGNADEVSNLMVGTTDVSRSSGGGLTLYNSSPTLTNVAIVNNQATSGSAIFATGSAPVLTNTLIVTNRSETGTVYLENSVPVVTNATIAANMADLAGGIYFTGATAASSIRNTIVYGNTASTDPNISIADGFAPIYEYSIIQGSGGSLGWLSSFGTDGFNNLDTDPKFYNPADQNFGLSVTSPAINAGNSSLFQSGSPDLTGVLTDVKGTGRTQKGRIDIGAIESLFGVLTTTLMHTGGRLYVKKGSTGDGSSWMTPVGEVADALLAATLNPDIHEIWVAGGIYHPLYRPDDFSSDGPAKYFAFVMAPNVKVYGGFEGDEGSLGDRERSIVANTSILSADFNENDEPFFQDFIESDDFPTSLDENALHVLYAVGEAGDAVLDGFTIEGANVLSSALVEDEDELISFLDETLLINGSEIPALLGSAVTLLGAKMTLSNIVVRNNLGFLGGGVTSFGNDLLLTNSLIYDNFTGVFGSGLFSFGVNLNMINSTITENFAYPLLGLPIGPGAFISSGASQISNSIIYGNMFVCCPSDLYVDVYLDDESLVISNSVAGESGGSDDWDEDLGTDGGGNLDEDPVFKDVFAKDFSLTACSRPVNAGTNIYYEVGGMPDLSSTLTDLAGNTRNFGGVVDMGAYEFQAVPSADMPPLAGNAEESYFVFTSNVAHVFTVPSGICTSDLLSVTPTDLAGGVYAVTWLDPQVKFFNGAPYVQRHFDIEPVEDPDNAKARVTLYFTQGEFDNFNQEVSPAEYLPTGMGPEEPARIDNLRIYQFHGLSDDYSGDPSTYDGGRTTIDPENEDIVWNSTLARWEVTFNVEAFSGFLAGTKTQSPLPVRLVSFQGKLTDDKKVKLDWQVAEQENIDAYAIEYSANGKAFGEIGKVFANSLEKTQYSYVDSVSRMGQYAYYRLRVTEMDGQKSFSRIAAIKLPASQHMAVYPVPSKNYVWVNWKGSLANSGELIDVTGRVLKTISRLEDAQRIDISGYTPGIYFLRIADTGSFKILKE